MVEIIPKKIPQIPKWLNVLFYLSLVVLLFSIISYFNLTSSLNKSQKVLGDLKETLLKEKTPERVSLEKEVLNYDRKIKNFLKIFNQHLESSEIFVILEKDTHPEVWFSKFKLNTRERTVALSGKAKSFESLGQQILIFKKEVLIKKVSLEKVSMGKEGEIKFDLSLSFAPIKNE